MGKKFKVAKTVLVGAAVFESVVVLGALKRFNLYKIKYNRHLWMSQQSIDLSHATVEDNSFAVALSELTVDLRKAVFDKHYTSYLLRAEYAHIRILLPDDVHLQIDGEVKCARAIHEKGHAAISQNPKQSDKYLILQYDIAFSSLEVIGGI